MIILLQISIHWSVPESKFLLSFSHGAGSYASNPHEVMAEQLQKDFNKRLNLPFLMQVIIIKSFFEHFFIAVRAVQLWILCTLLMFLNIHPLNELIRNNFDSDHSVYLFGGFASLARKLRKWIIHQIKIWQMAWLCIEALDHRKEASQLSHINSNWFYKCIL